jgi:protein-S-isoprenylcysteine O-methyltransferase
MFHDVSGVARSVFWALLAVYWISESIMLRRRRAGREEDDDRGSTRWLAILFPLSWWSAVALIWAVPQAAFGNATIFSVGLLIMAAAQLLRWWSVATLGRLFTVNVAIRTDHRLIESGPYRSVRHPAYTAILLFHLGSALCFGNALSLVALMVPSTIALLKRMRVEEAVLESGLGQPYREYMARTKRLIPGLY